MSSTKQTIENKTTTFKRATYLVGTIFFGIVTYTTATGDLQNHIHFAGIANEIGFFFFGSMLTVGCAYLTIAE